MSTPSGERLMLCILQKMEDGAEYKRVEMFELLNPIFQPKEGLEIKLQNNIGWAFTFLTRAEFIKKSLNKKAGYFITEAGRKALREGLNGAIINEKYLQDNSPKYLENIKLSKEKKRESNKVGVLELRNYDQESFTDFCLGLLEKMNYQIVTKKEIKLTSNVIYEIIYIDALGIKDKIYIQCKPFGEATLQEIKAFLYIACKERSKGIFISTSGFLSDVKEAVKEKSVALIDDKKLIELCLQYKHSLKPKEDD